jgi:mannosyltransferase
MVPFVIAAARQASQLNWISAPGEGTFGAVLVTQFFPANIPLAVLGWALAIAGAVLLLRRPDAAATAALAITTIVVPLAVLLLFSLTVLPVFTPRYLTFATLAMALLVAVAIDAIPRRMVGYAALTLVVALSAPSWLDQRQPIGKGSDAAAVASYVENVEARHPGDAVGIVWGDLARFPLGTARVVEYGYPAPFAAIADLTLAQTAAEAGTLWETTRPLTAADLDGVDAVWVVASSLDSRFGDLRLLSAEGFRPAERQSFYQLEAMRLVREN